MRTDTIQSILKAALRAALRAACVLPLAVVAASGQTATVSGGPSLAFGTTFVNVTTAAQTLTVTADSTTTLDQITSSQLTVPSGFSATIGTCTTPGPGNSCTIDVAFTPTAIGPVSGNLIITATTNAGMTPVTVTPSSIALSGTGYQPTVAVQLMGKVVTLTNQLSSPLTFTYSLSGGSSSPFVLTGGTCPASGTGSLASGSCTITIGAASTPSTESDTLTVTALSGSTSVPVTGSPATIGESGGGVSSTGSTTDTGLEQAISLTAGPANATMPDGTVVPMWGYNCGAAVANSGATCAKLNPAATGWSPVVITVPSGQDLEIELTNNLPVPPGAGANAGIPTSLTIVGQLGGGLGDVTQRTLTNSPDHTNAQPVTWPIPANPPGAPLTGVGTPPVQGQRVQSFATEVATGMMADLIWKNLKPGTYLLESGTHPSIQGPMGLYGIVVVTCPPGAASTTCSTPGFAYPGVAYNAEVPLLFSEIDPVQNKAVQTAVSTASFSETKVWSGQPGQCGNPSAPVGVVNTCYPPAVNYTPLYYLINGVAFNKNSAASSLFPVSPATGLTAGGNVLVRLVNGGLRMHVPSIVGSQTGTSGASGFSLIAEDGNPLPGVPRVQSEVFMAAGKTNDVMINVPAAATAVPVYDRELSLSGNATARDAGMLAYININGVSPTGGIFAPATPVARPDTYNSVIGGQTITVSDPSKGVIGNDTNVWGVQVLVGPTGGTLTLNRDGTFKYVANTGTTTDSFTYCANGTVTGTTCSSGITAMVTLGSAPIEVGGISCTLPTPPTYTSNVATTLSIKPSGILSFCKDAAGYPLTVALSAGNAPVPSPGLTLSVDPNGGFNASVTAAGTYSFTFKAQNSQGTLLASAATVNLNFLAASNLAVTVKDGMSGAVIADYRWIIEEDRTFYIDPNCTQNPPPAGCPTAANGIVPTFGTNFHTSYMPVVAAGCTGTLSCESGQTVFNPATGNHESAVCDIGNGVCRSSATLSLQQTPLMPSQVHLDPTKRYYISVLPGDAANPFPAYTSAPVCTVVGGNSVPNATCGHGMGGAPIPPPATLTSAWAPVTVLSQPSPYPPAKLSVFVFEDDFPLNGEHDAGGAIDVLATNEPGLGGFEITLFDDAGGTGDSTGQPTYNMFNQPLTNSLAGTIDPTTGLDACPVVVHPRQGMVDDLNFPPNSGHLIYDVTQTGITGMIVTCPRLESDGITLSPLAGQAVVDNLYAGRYGVVATPGADRIARGEEWLQTNTLDGQKAHDSFMRIGEPEFFQEFGPAGHHVSIGFANPKIINGRKAGICNGTDLNLTAPNCNHSVTGQITTSRMSRTPDERLYSSGDYSSFAFTQCYVSLGDTDGEDFAFTKCNPDGTFTLNGIPDGDWRITVFDQWNDMLVDGLSTPVGLGPNFNATNECPGPTTSATTCDKGQIAMNQWQANIYTKTFFDTNGNGTQDSTEDGLALVSTNIRFRDGSYSNFNNTDLMGNAGFNEVFPLFSWYVVETDSTRYKSTGAHLVYDAGGPADGTCTASTAPCGSSMIGSMMANTAETLPVPTNLRVPGAFYCANADCTDAPIPVNHPASSTPYGAGGSTGRVDPAFVHPYGSTYGWQGFSGQNSFIEFGKKPFAPGETGGIRGEVIYASTRPFDDPSLLIHTSWTPDVPGVTINLYQEGTAPDGSQSLTMVDTTKTSSFDDWAQGFRSDGVPYMNCPGQGRDTGTNSDLFFFSLYNQPNYLDFYNSQHGGPPPTLLPNNAQFKCYDGMHNWNQIQPVPYDGMYQFPSITGLDPVTGKPTGTNCKICVTNPDSSDPYRYGGPTPGPWTAGNGAPMLPPGKYVVEVIVPPGYELVKEEDKNILVGDNFIAPATVQFPGLGGGIYILPDQAAIGATYNANSAQNSVSDLGRPKYPQGEGDTGSVEQFWPCVGASRIVPDFLSLFPAAVEISPFAGATRNLCDRKEVTLEQQQSALAKFWIFSSTHVTAHFTGVITDDFTSEFDPFSPQFGEKFSPANLPISIKDWTGNEISRVYTDHWGAYDGLNYSTWEVNPPNPTGYGPTMMITCMNDPGSGPTPDPLFNPSYSQFCYEIPFMPGQTQYMDTPVVPTSAFAGAGYNNPDCNYPDQTPAIKEVDGDGVGPWVAAPNGAIPHTLTITALGVQSVNNYGYSGPSATTVPFNQKTVTRNYGFGTTKGTVTIGGISVSAGNITTWSDTTIVLNVPAGVPDCAMQQQAQYGGSSAQCGELVITRGDNHLQSIDTVTVTIGGKPPTHIPASGTIQGAIDAAAPGDLLIVDPTCTTATGPVACTTAGATANSTATHQELVVMWKPVRLQGVGAASSVINANTHPAGKLDAWRQRVNCLFGLAINGQPYSANSPTATPVPPATSLNPYDPTGMMSCPGTGWNYFNADGGSNDPQVDRLPLEGIVGWDATVNGNLAELLQEPSLMGAYEGAGITVLAKGVRFPCNPTNASTCFVFGNGPDTGNLATESQFPLGSVPLTSSDADCLIAGPNPTGYASNFQCNPSSIDGLAVTNASQGGGGIFLHAWAHNMQIANNRVYNNTGTLSGGIVVGQGESPDALLNGNEGNPIGFDQQPWTCYPGGVVGGVQQQTIPGLALGTQLPYCYDTNVNVHHNYVTNNSSIGDEIFSGTPAGAGGATFCIGADYYKFQYNWVCGNLSTGDGGGLAHIGFIWSGDIQHNTIIFNQSTNPTIATNGGGLIVMGAAPDGVTPVGPECGSVTDIDCAPGLSDGTGPGLVIDANLLMGNAAESGSGGGLRLQSVNGTDVIRFPLVPTANQPTSQGWNKVQVTNNIIANNVAGWDGGGVSLQDALAVDFINNTVMSNDTTASSGVLFNTLGAPLASAPGAPNQCPTNPCGTTSQAQPAGLVSMQNSSNLTAAIAALPLVGGIAVNCPPGHYTSGSAGNGNCTQYSVPILYNDVFFQNRSFYIGVGSLGTGTQNQQNVVALYNQGTTTQAVTQPTTDATTANGNGVVITGGTGACVTASYWDLGVRGDTGPTDHSGGLTLVPEASFLTSIAGYPGGGTGFQVNSASNPTVLSQYCNGSRTPPEFKSLGYQVPPGISDATVPNPIFNLTPAATVDEGNNWINIQWGPLSLTNPVSNIGLGNYGPAPGSLVINYITPANSINTYTAAPPLDFYGNARRANGAVDAGAVEFVSGTGPANVFVTGGPLPFGNVGIGGTSAAMTLTLHNQGTAGAGGINVTFSSTPNGTSGSVFTRPAGAAGGTCGASLGGGNTCTINVVFSPTAVGAYTGLATITTAVNAVSGSPVELSGSGVTPILHATVTPSPLAFTPQLAGSTSSAQTLTVTNDGNTSLAGGTFTFGGGTPQPFSRPAGAAGGTCVATLGVGASCTINVVFAPATAGSFPRNLTVGYTGATVVPTPVLLTGTGFYPVSPTTLTFPATQIGQTSATQTVTLSNPGSTSLTIALIANAGTNPAQFVRQAASTCPVAPPAFVLAAGGNCTVVEAFAPTGAVPPAARSALMNFTITGGANPYQVSISGTAQAASATLLPTPLAFGNQQVGTTHAPLTLTYSNTGVGPITVATTPITGANAANFAISTNNCTAVTLVPGVNPTCTILVTFTPSATGARTATLTVTDTAGGAPAQAASLTGTGTVAVVGFTPAGIGSWTTTSGPHTVTVTNTGVAGTNASLTGISVTNATGGAQFALTAGGTCTTSTVLASGANCTVIVTRTRPAATPFVGTGTLTLTDTGAAATTQTLALSGT
jgi:hypothetical protein